MRIIFAIVMTLLLSDIADAKVRHRKDYADIISEMEKMRKELTAIKQQLMLLHNTSSVEKSEDKPPSQNPILALPPMPVPDHEKTLKSYRESITRSTKVADLTPKLALKVEEILASCDGARLVSGYRKGARIKGSGRPSLHSQYPSKAADLAGNPACIKRHMEHWGGGMSVDYRAVGHYHISYDEHGREWGARFSHYRGRNSGRYARHIKRHERYATAQYHHSYQMHSP